MPNCRLDDVAGNLQCVHCVNHVFAQSLQIFAYCELLSKPQLPPPHFLITPKRAVAVYLLFPGLDYLTCQLK